MVLQIPVQVPVMRRELMSKMYTTGNYYYARYVSNLVIFVAYPTILTIILYWALGITYDFT